MSRGASLRIQEVATLDEIPQSLWDSLSGARSFYLCHDWLSYVESETGAADRYLMAWSDGGLAGALPTYALSTETNKNYQTAHILGGRVPGSYLITGTRRAYVNDTMLANDSRRECADQALDCLLSAADEQARALGLDGVAFLYLRTEAAQRLLGLRGDIRPLLLGIDTELSVPGNCFDDYLDEVGKRRASGVRHEMRSFAAAGYQVSVEKLADCWYEMGPLVASVQQKYGHPDSIESCRGSLRKQAESLNPHSLVFTARRSGVLVGCALFYAWRRTLFGRVVGFDYTALADVGEYFNLYFYEPLRYAYASGHRCLHLGRGSFFAKLRRGAQPRALWAAFAPSGSWSADWRAFNRQELQRCQDQWRFSEIDAPSNWLSRE